MPKIVTEPLKNTIFRLDQLYFLVDKRWPEASANSDETKRLWHRKANTDGQLSELYRHMAELSEKVDRLLENPNA